MAKVKLKSGDIFEIPLEGKKAYMQFLFQDSEYLGGHLIRAFNYEIPNSQNADVSDIVKSGVKFYAYTRLIQGIEENLWTRITNSPIEADFIAPIFRQTTDVY